MDLPMDNDEAQRDNLNENANAEAPIQADIDEDHQEMMMLDDDDMEDGPPNLRSLGSYSRKLGVRAIFTALQSKSTYQPTEVILLYLLYPDLRQEIVQELRAFMRLSGRCDMLQFPDAFGELGEHGVAEEIEQEHSEALLEFVDVLGSFMMETWRETFSALCASLKDVEFPLHGPLGAVVAAKLLRYAQSYYDIERLALWCEHQFRGFRPDEVTQLVNSILNLKDLGELVIHMDMTGVLLVELCAKLKDLKYLSQLRIHAAVEDALKELPNERNLIRHIQQISSLKILHLSSAMLGESTVDLFVSSEGAYTILELENCQVLIGSEDDKDPSESPLAVALANNTRLEYLSLNCVQGSGAFYVGIEHGLLNNRTLRTLRLMNFTGVAREAHQRTPEFAYFGWIRSIRLHPSLRRLDLDMAIWSDRVAEALCSIVRDNTSLHSMDLFHTGDPRETDNAFDPEWIGAVLQALQVNRTIVDIRIGGRWDFGDRNWNRLAELLTVNDAIETINLDAGDESIPERVIELLQRIKSNRTLQGLGVRNAQFRNEHARALVDVLADNYVLVSLVYDWDRVGYPISCSDEGSQRLLNGILNLNHRGRKYMRTEPNSVEHGVPLLAQVSYNLNAVYFHLRENPRLCDRREWKQIVAVNHVSVLPCGSDKCDRKRLRPVDL